MVDAVFDENWEFPNGKHNYKQIWKTHGETYSDNDIIYTYYFHA